MEILKNKIDKRIITILYVQCGYSIHYSTVKLLHQWHSGCAWKGVVTRDGGMAI